jgi:uncharacterized protein YkwD
VLSPNTHVRALLGAIAAVLTVAPAAWAACDDEELRPAAADELRRHERAIACLVDDERRRHGRAPLGDDRRLALAAQRHADDMVERSYFSHVSPGGDTVLDRLRRAGYGRRGVRLRYGETLAWGTRRSSTARSIVRRWMQSPGHRALLLDGTLREVGVGTARGTPVARPAGVTVAAAFGRIG